MFSSEAVMRRTVAMWRASNRYVARPHVCSAKTCRIERLVVYVFDDGGKLGVAWKAPEGPAQKITSIFMCRDTGEAHWCSRSCSAARIVSEDEGRVCSISGIRYENVHADDWRPTQRITSTAREQYDPYRLGKADASKAISLREQQYVNIVRDMIDLLLFSQKRMYQEYRKYAAARQASRTIIQKFIKSCERCNKMIRLPQLITIYIRQMNQKPILKHMEQDKKKQNKLKDLYVKRITKLWRAILQHTPIGRAQPGIFIFKAFCIATLYQMRTGLWCRGQCIIQQDYFLDRCLPETNTLDNYDISKPQFTQAKNNILKAIRDAEEKQIDIRLLIV